MNEIRSGRLEEILKFNEVFVQNKGYVPFVTTKEPLKKLVILACMDTRLTELLPQAMNIKNGDAKIIKNAGATIMHPFGSIARSIIVAIYAFQAEDIFVVGHYGCGMCRLDSEKILMDMREHGIEESTFKLLQHSGINVEKWLKGFDSEEEAVKESVQLILNHPLVPKGIRVHGLMIHPETGALTLLEKLA
jgi:carbonic anhydrase